MRKQKSNIPRYKEPKITLEREADRKKRAQEFLKRIENDKDAMQLFISKMKQTDTLADNKMRLTHVTSFDRSYLHANTLEYEEAEKERGMIMS